MSIKIYIFIYSIFLLLPVNNIVIEKRIKIISDFFTVDKIGNIYSIKNNQLTKISETGKIIKIFSGNLHEKITYIDVSDPFKIMLFYKDFNKIIFTDNNLTQIGKEINPDNFGIYEISALCKSGSGGFWIIDAEEKTLCKFNYLFKLEFKKQLFDIEQDIINIQEFDNKLYIYGKQNLIYIFDMYGTKIIEFSLKVDNNFRIANNKIIFFDKSKSVLNQFDILNFTEEKINIPDSLQCKDAIISRKKLFLMTENEIIIAKYNKL